jgi:RimJ/RimL family protein N-acetyltransferase
MIEGIHTYLRPMEIEDVPYKVNWVNDKEVIKTLVFFDYPVSKIKTEQWLRNVSSNSSRRDFIVCLKSDSKPIGFVGLKDIDFTNLKAESYMCIGDKEYWGKGYGYDIKKALLMYCFDILRLNKIYSYHLADNASMIKINLKLGGKQEAILREDVFYNGGFKDRVLTSVLKNEMIK